MFILFVLVSIALSGTNAQGWGKAEPSPKVQYIWLSSYPECEGKDGGNYTGVSTEESDAQCSINSLTLTSGNLITWTGHHEKAIISEQLLAISRYPDGAYIIYESLSLATSGPLEGKFIFIRAKHLVADYLKKCSSVLGISAIVSKSAELLISDKLSPEVLLYAGGAYEAFKKGCTTICKGQKIGV